ncbi:MAG: glycosyltransferase family 2 protein, partial [Flavobacteriaceae bacterium]|nr:glycosyltransferase family 2 protein [Flavobacteriaceae bacterium]
MKLSIIIVNYKVPYFLEQCLLSVQAASKNITTEIIVVDNNSTDVSCTVIRDKFPVVKLIENKKNVGFSKANNQGVAVAEGEFILILNPDTVIAEDTLDTVLTFADKQENLGAIGIKFIDGTGNFLPECKRNIPTIKIANQKIRGNTQKYYANHIDENKIAKVEILTGAFMLMKREGYLEVGGFDEDYFMFGEDIDLSYKLLNNGFQNYYFGETTMLHYKGESTIKDLTYLKNFYNAMQIFYKKHYK